ncbi:glutamate synthase subunit beta [Bryobacter aggregatus]|uniref:glutamate synthase subunit beta n=1 Tax=Bryobacter aggregatus TaxID=360054 RepID=UPI0004E1F4CA|nr:glutamate synthase subunit beta [Bryobacter aggregatus]
MGKHTGFLEIQREIAQRRPVPDRVKDWREVYEKFPLAKVREQGARCMDCGVPFCHTGCPLNNLIPDWNDLVYRDRWQDAIRQLHATNNFPEFTGRLCPAPCESACVLGINEAPVSIKQVEKSIIDHAFESGWIVPELPTTRTGKKVAIIGSGPAGLAAAQQLNRAGHTVTVIERDPGLGGLLRFGIPDFKMEKHHIDRRIEQLQAEGIKFLIGVNVGVDMDFAEIRKEYDATLLAIGAEQHRDVKVPGRHLKGIYYAMDYLPQANKVVGGLPVENQILATGKNVIIIGGGDTGADCLGTATRQGAKSIRQFMIHQRPPDERAESTPWPLWPVMYREEPAHEENGLREFAVATTSFTGDDEGNVKHLHGVRVGSAPGFEPVKNSEFTLDAELVLIAIGFAGVRRPGLIEKTGARLDARGNIVTKDNYETSLDGVFAAGDARRGASLIVWAIAEGRRAARAIDERLVGSSQLPN